MRPHGSITQRVWFYPGMHNSRNHRGIVSRLCGNWYYINCRYLGYYHSYRYNYSKI